MEKYHEPLYFLGPKSENRPFFMEMISLLLNDHVYWRRNFHPKDPPVLSFSETQSIENQLFKENFTNELFKLLADLKMDPPFFSPRYMAHMLSENSLPGLVAYIATLLYNPNNVSSEAAPVTLKYEIEVAKQLAYLFGLDPEKTFGHLTGGGTVANYESLFYNLNLRFIPLSLAMTLIENNISLPDTWTLSKLVNTPYEDYTNIINQYNQLCQKHQFSYHLYKENQLSFLGLRSFEKKYYKLFKQQLPDIKIIVPATAHYSWSRGVKLCGLGIENLIKIKLNKDFQMDLSFLEKELLKQKDQKNIVLQLVGVYGTTEFGSFDQIHHLVALKEKFQSELYFPIHIDAAYGGYFSSMFYETQGKSTFIFNSRLREKHDALKFCDSFTIDPHKLGFAPYGAGAFLFRHGHLKDFIAENADYCFNPQSDHPPLETELGKYILEGSKPGASAAAVYFNHKLIPLNYHGQGKILENLAITAQNFASLLIKHSDSNLELIALNNPQSNIVCFVAKHSETKTVTQLNQLTTKIAARFGVKRIDNIQEYDYIVSNTTLNTVNISEIPESLNELEQDCNQINLVRMVFMNQWHQKENSKEKTYLESFIQTLIDYTKQLIDDSSN